MASMNGSVSQWAGEELAVLGSALLRRFFKRLYTKVMGMVPILVGALVLTVILSVVIYALIPLLPDEYQELLREAQRGDWETRQQRLLELVEGFGPAKPYIFLTLQVLQVVFAPIPGQLIGLLAGHFFGFWRGLFLSMLGLAIGSFLAMGLGRLLGEKLVRRVVPASVRQRFDYLVEEGGLWNFFMLFLLPFFPDDAICFIAGLTRWRLLHLLAVCLVGRLPGVAVLTFLGDRVGGSMVWANTVLGVAMAAAIVLWLYSDEVEEYFYRWSKGLAASGRKPR